jgi:hypothetical protein
MAEIVGDLYNLRTITLELLNIYGKTSRKSVGYLFSKAALYKEAIFVYTG